MTDPDPATLLVVDGHSLAFRAYYALPVENFTTKDGQHTNGIYGFLSMFVNLLAAEGPTHVAVAIDYDRETCPVPTVIALGESLGLEVIAEGVETQEHRDALQQWGCRFYQGYLYSRPLALEDLESYLDEVRLA